MLTVSQGISIWCTNIRLPLFKTPLRIVGLMRIEVNMSFTSSSPPEGSNLSPEYWRAPCSLCRTAPIYYYSGSTRSEHCPLPRFPVCLSPNGLSLQLILGYRLAHSYGWTPSNILWAIRIYRFHLSETDLMTVDVELQDAHGIESVEVSLNGQPHKISQSRTRSVFRQQFARPLWVLTWMITCLSA